MKLTTWTATPNGRALTLSGTSDTGEIVTLNDVLTIENNWREDTTLAIRKADAEGRQEKVLLS